MSIFIMINMWLASQIIPIFSISPQNNYFEPHYLNNIRYLFYTPPPAKHSTDNSIYQFSVKDIDGNVVNLDKYHDKV